MVTLGAFAGACGRGEGSGRDGRGVSGTVTGRVMSVSADRACVSADRGTTSRCLGFGGSAPAPAVEVGQCVTMTPRRSPAASRFEVVDDAACAAGDVGDGGG